MHISAKATMCVKGNILKSSEKICPLICIIMMTLMILIYVAELFKMSMGVHVSD